MEKKKTSGRRKIEIEKIQSANSRQVAFSKRRTGVFNKASELCVLTAARILILVQSVGGRRVYAFAHPDTDSLLDSFLENNNIVSNSCNDPVMSENTTRMIEEFEEKYLQILKELEAEKNKSIHVEQESNDGYWWLKSFQDLEMDELENFVNSMEQLKINVTKRADELRDSVSSSSFDTMANANNFDALLDDQGIRPQLLPDNVGVANQDMNSGVDFNYSGFINNYFGNGGLVNDNDDHGDNNLQVQSVFGSFGVPDDLPHI